MNLPALNSLSRLRYSDSQQTAWIPESSEDGSSGPQGRGWEEKGECREPPRSSHGKFCLPKP